MTGPRLSIIPARAATDRALKPRDLQVLCVLGRHTDELGWCRKSQVKMADEMGCARSTVFEAIERLVKAGYLERHIQEEDNGRDSPHIYRVILDPKHPDPGGVRDADDDADPCRLVGTPAGISAPPAGPESAPPAGPGPAPKNDPLRTTHQNENERERGREDDREHARKVDRWVKRHHPRWPSYVSDSEPKARAAALALSDEDRAAAADRMDDYIAGAKAGGRQTICTFSVYLAERRWEKLPARPAQPLSDYAPPFGPVWSAWVMARLLGGPEQADAAAALDRWPLVANLYRMARMHRGHRFGERWHGLKSAMEPVPVGSSTMAEWQALFERRGWPWLPDPGDQPVIFFPAGGPEGLAAFERAVRAGEPRGGEADGRTGTENRTADEARKAG